MFQFNFSDYSPAVYIRQATQELIQPYANASKFYSHDMLRPLLCEVFKWMEFEVSQELMKVLSFGKEKYVKITLEEMIDYTMEKHLGENAMLRYVKKKGYARRDEEIMNKNEFLETLAMGLDYLKGFSIAQFLPEFQIIFDNLDKRKVGTISKTEYCLFLKHYFGSESPMAVNPTKRVKQLSQSQQLISMSPREDPINSTHQSPASFAKTEQRVSESPNNNASINQITSKSHSNRSLKLRTALDEFQDIITSSITQKCQEYDVNGDGFLSRSECQNFLYEVLELQLNSIDFIINNYFRFHQTAIVGYKELIQIVCEVHFRQIFTNIIKNQQQIQTPNKIYMDKDYFVNKVMQNCYFFPVRPHQSLLEKVFQELLLKADKRSIHKITLDDFRSFILVYCCNNKLIFRHQAKKSTHNLNNPPASIAEAENSHYQEDQSQNSSYRPSRKDFGSAQKSATKGKDEESKQHSIEGGDIRLSSNKRTRNNKLSQQSININLQSQSVPASYSFSSREVNSSALKPKIQSSESIKLVRQQNLLAGRQDIELTRQQKEQIVMQEKKSFKDVLWAQLETIINKYCVSSRGQLNKEQCEKLFNNEEFFNQDRNTFKNKLGKLFARQTYASNELIASYIIHLKGEEALLEFNKKQIKGKSALNESEIAEILYYAYGLLVGHPKEEFEAFSKLLFNQNRKSLFQYKNYLELIARNLSVRNNF